jgi:hypothetical protein
MPSILHPRYVVRGDFLTSPDRYQDVVLGQGSLGDWPCTGLAIRDHAMDLGQRYCAGGARHRVTTRRDLTSRRH